jgi:RNA polymerase sporulation-specific sigma factor
MGAEQEDLIQEGMIGLYKACQSFSRQSGASFKSFAHLCIKRQMQSAIKSANRQKNLALNNALALGSKNGIVFVDGDSAGENEKIIYLPLFQESPENEMIHQENYDEMLENIKKSLSPFEYKVLEFYLDGYKCSQIANLTGNSSKTIDNALYRIKNKLSFLNEKK